MSAAIEAESDSSPLARFNRFRHWILLFVGVAALQTAFYWVDEFPALLDHTFSDPIDSFGRWQHANRKTHILFTGFFNPLSDSVGWALDSLETWLLWVPWFVLPIVVFLIVYRSRGWKDALVPAAAMTYPGLVGLWEVTIDTLALMTISVILSVLIGVPLGIWGAVGHGPRRSCDLHSMPCKPCRLRSISFPC